MPVIGITGGVGAGKSEAVRLLGERGAIVLSADRIAREVLSPGSEALAEVVARFGPDVLGADGGLDRLRLAAIVFDDPEARRDLERLTHPRILRRLRDRIDRACRDSGSRVVIAVEVPLLFEVGLADWFDMVVVVAADERTQVEILGRRMTDTVLLIKALGGGWDASQLPDLHQIDRATVSQAFPVKSADSATVDTPSK